MNASILDLTACTKCNLGTSCLVNTKIVNGKGNPNAKIMVIGEAPSLTESYSGNIYTGELADQFTELLTLAGISKDELYFTNVCRCYSWENKKNEKTGNDVPTNRPPTKQEISECIKYLREEIDILKPKVIIALGGTVLSALENKVSKISERKGIPSLYGVKNLSGLYGNRTYIMPIMHPSSIKKNGGIRTSLGLTKMAEEYVSHLKKAKEMLDDSSLFIEHSYFTVKTVEDVLLIKERILERKVMAFDIETTGLQVWDKILGVGIAIDVGKSCYIPFLVKEFMSETLDEYWSKEDKVNVIEILKEIFEDSTIYKSAHNAKFDMRGLKSYLGIEVKGLFWDSICGAYLLNENGAHGLDDLKNKYIDLLGYSERYIRESKDGKQAYNCCLETISNYCMGDCDATYRLTKDQIGEFDSHPNFRFLMEEFYVPLMEVFTDIEYSGVLYDKPLGLERRKELKKQSDQLLLDIHKHAGKKFNPNSPEELAQILFTVLKLKHTKTTKGGKTGIVKQSVDAEVLEDLAKEHVVPKLVVDYRHCNKMISTYIDGMIESMDKGGRVHCAFNPIGTVTGRPSCEGLMNIPKEGTVKNLFIAKEGYKLVQGDESQAEVRCFAHYANEEVLRKAFETEGIDVHCLVAAEVRKIPYEEMFKKAKIEEIPEYVDLRSAAKGTTFGLLFGRGPQSIALEYGFSLEVAQEFMKAFFNRFKNCEAWIKSTHKLVAKTGEVQNIFGRVRRLPGIFATDNEIKARAERQSVNSIIQSTASDITCMALIDIHRHLKYNNIPANIVLTVYDSIITETRDDYVDYVKKLTVDMMEKKRHKDFSVKMKADVDVYQAWGLKMKNN